MVEIKKNKFNAMIAALVTFVVVGFLAVQAMYYLKGYAPLTNMRNHSFLVSVGILIGAVAASYSYNYMQGEDKSSWLHEKNEEEEE